MPDSPDVDLSTIESQAIEMIDAFAGKPDAQKKVEKEPVAFGLVALNIMFLMDEEQGSPDDLEEKLGAIEGVQNAQVTDVRRALG